MDKKKSSTKPHIATLGSLRKPESSSSDEEGQAFYVGGSTRSGQQVLGPSKNSENSDELISNMFKAVKEGGFEMTNEERQNEIKKQFQPFKGNNNFFFFSFCWSLLLILTYFLFSSIERSRNETCGFLT